MTESQNHNLILIKYCLPLVAVSFVMLLSGFFNANAETVAFWDSIGFTLLGSIIGYFYASSKVEETYRLEVKSTDLDAKRLSNLHYHLHLINPEGKLQKKISFSLRLLSDFLPDSTFACYLCEEKGIRFISASKKSSTGKIENINENDPLIIEISAKINTMADYKKLVNSNALFKPLIFSNNNVQGQILPVELHSKLSAILVELREENLSNSDSEILTEFCKGLAIVIENHKILESNLNLTNRVKAELPHIDDLKNFSSVFFESMQQETLPTLTGWDLANYFLPSNNRADFIDIFETGNGRLMILFGKCSGRGLNAAIYVNKLKLLTKCFIEDSPLPAQLLNRLSKYLNTDLMPDSFVELTAMSISSLDSQGIIAMAGNTLPIINRTRNGFAEIPQLETGIPLGLFNQGTDPYKNQHINLMPGDGILLHTDGICDFPSEKISRLNNEKIKNILEKLPEDTAQNMLNGLIKEIKGNNSSDIPEEDHSLIYLKME